MGVVTYPSEAKTDSDKLTCVYNLIEQARLAHNAQGAIASADWENNKGKWAAYSKIFHTKQLVLLREQNRLRDKIWAAHYTKEEWKALSTDEKRSAFNALFGSKMVLRQVPTTATSPILEEIKTLRVAEAERLDLIDPVEDFTTYTEVDEGGDITVTSTKCDVSTMIRNVVSYVRKDMDANHFTGNFEHLITASVGTFDNNAYIGWWGVSDGNSTYSDMKSGSDGYGVGSYGGGGTANLELTSLEDGETYDEFTGGAEGSTWYLTIERSSTTLTCKIFSDAGRTLLEDTLTLTVTATAFRYIMAIFSADSDWNADHVGTGYSENLDLQEGGAASAVVYGFVV